jgi:hypothetical protein
MGNAPGKNCGNTTWTQECCGDVIGFQEICGDLEYCDHLETAGDIRRFCSTQEGTLILIFIVCVACIFLYSYRNQINDKFTKKPTSREPRASEAEMEKFLDDSFKL